MNTRTLTRSKMDGTTKRLLVILLFFLVVACVTKPANFMNLGNFQSIGKQLAEYGLMTLGVGVCMISGGIDLSVVYIANLCGIVGGMIMRAMGVSGILPGIGAALLVGALCGMFNGFLVARLHIPAMLATLGSYQLFMGIAIVLSGGSTVSGLPKSYSKTGNSLVFGLIPLSFVIFLAAVLVIHVVMTKTTFGKRVYLVGTNEKAAAFSGINRQSVLVRAYMISGLVSAVAGLVSLSRINSAKADFGSSYTMQTILIAVLGGVNPNGGFGKVQNFAIAVVILQLLSSFLNMFPNISNFYRDLIWGVALIGVLIANLTIDKHKAAKLSNV